MSEYNWEARDILSIGPKYRIDISNPQMGCNGPDTYNMYSTNDSKDAFISALSEGGLYRLQNDRSIEIVAGEKNEGNGIDIVISGKNGDVTITAEKNGKIRIRGQNVMIEADEDVDIKAGRNINLSSGSGRILLKGNKVDASGLTGNVIEAVGGGFGASSFLGSFVGADIVSSVFNGGVPPEVGAAPSTAPTSAPGETATENLQVGESNTETQAAASAEADLIESQQAQTLQQGGSIVEGNTTTSFELL
jgi:hypothetical protein